MTKTLSMIEARNRLTSMPEWLDREKAAVAVTRRGKPVLAVLPWELYESINETLEIMEDQDLMKALRKSIREMKQGKGVPWEKVRTEI